MEREIPNKAATYPRVRRVVPENAEFLTVRELAKLLRLSEDVVRARLADGTVPGLVRVGRTVRVSLAAVRAWLEAGGGAGGAS